MSNLKSFTVSFFFTFFFVAGCVPDQDEGDFAAADEAADVADVVADGPADVAAGGSGAAHAAAATPTCPTASESWSLSLFWWKTTRQLEHFVWSSDASRLLGVELLFEEKKSWDPLSGTTLKRKLCHQLFLVDANGANRVNLGGVAPYQAGETFAFPQAGYVTAQTFRDGAWDFVHVTLAGARRVLGSVSGRCEWARAIPSPDGAVIAFVRTSQAGCDTAGATASSVDVSFFDAAGALLPGHATVSLAGFGLATWTPAGQLVVTDDSAAVRVAIDGSVLPASVPGCTEPPTTSGEVDAAGRLVGVVNGAPAILGTDATRAFGCQ